MTANERMRSAKKPKTVDNTLLLMVYLSCKGYCEEHIKKHNKEYNDWHRGYKSGERYDWRWRKIRAKYVKAHPLCEECLKHKIYVPVQVVHHIKPKSEGGSDDFENLMSLCHSCHMKIHGIN